MERLIQRLQNHIDVDERLMNEIESLWQWGINRINNDNLKQSIIEFFELKVPWQFFVTPTSSTGKRHPEHHNERGGLLRHIIETCVLADTMLKMYGYYESETEEIFSNELDIVLAATLISDTFKKGSPWGEETRSDHGEIAANEWLPIVQKYNINQRVIHEIYKASYWHYGRWTPNETANFQDLTDLVQIVHILDMVSSAGEISYLFQAREKITPPQ